jgi:hypothetical protein
MMMRKELKMIRFVAASEGKIELVGNDHSVIVASNDVNTLAETIRSVGFDSDGAYFTSSMDFADEYGFASYGDATMMNEGVIMTTVNFNAKTGNYEAKVGKRTITSYSEAYVKRQLAKMAPALEAAAQREAENERFGINTRFEFVEKLVNMVASGVQPSAVITGEGGLGKTYTVRKTLEDAGLEDMTAILNEAEDGDVIENAYITIKGFSTAKGLYRTLYENNGKIILFDDCDSILKDPVALNILKGALDSYDRRYISWNAEMKESDDLPRSFEFTGSIIFISNMDQDKIDQAVRSRSMMIDLSMTDEQKIDRMEHIALSGDFLPQYDAEIKTDALNLLREIKDEVKEISLRTLIAVAKIRASNTDWKDLATYMLTA